MSYTGNLETHRGLIGKIGEDMAADYLLSIGHKILDRNYRIKYGEIDIISIFNETIHYTEVKTTQSTSTRPEEHIDAHKMLKMKNLAELHYKNITNSRTLHINSISLDFIGICLTQDKKLSNLNHIQSLEV